MQIRREFDLNSPNSLRIRSHLEFGVQFTVLRIRREFVLQICRGRQNDHLCPVFRTDEKLALNRAMQFFWTLYNENYDNCTSIEVISFWCGACGLIFENDWFFSFKHTAVSAYLH